MPKSHVLMAAIRCSQAIKKYWIRNSEILKNRICLKVEKRRVVKNWIRNSEILKNIIFLRVENNLTENIKAIIYLFIYYLQ